MLTVNSGTGTALYRRSYHENKTWVAINNSDVTVSMPLPAELPLAAADLLGDQPITRSSGNIAISLRPRSAAIVAAPASRSIARDLATATTLTRNSEIIR